MTRNRIGPRRRRGSATIELSIMLPLLITVGVIATDFGRFAHTHIAVTNAARAGAGFGSMHRVTPTTLPLWRAAIRQAVEIEMANNAWFDADVIDPGSRYRSPSWKPMG